MNHIQTAYADLNTMKTPFNWAGVGFLLFMIGIAAIPAMFIVGVVFLGRDAGSTFGEIINAQYFNQPLVIICHGLSGIVFFITMPFQFSTRLRKTYPNYHKINGYAAFVSANAMAASGVWMHHVFSAHVFGARYVCLIIVALAICVTFAVAIYYAVQGNIKDHQRWIYYGAAASLAVVTPLFFEIIVVVLGGVGAALMYAYGRVIALIFNLLVTHQLYQKTAKSAR